MKIMCALYCNIEFVHLLQCKISHSLHESQHLNADLDPTTTVPFVMAATEHSRNALSIVDPGRGPEALHPGDEVVHARVDVHYKR